MLRIFTCFTLAVITIAIGSVTVSAQTTVQLPTFSSFGYSGSVLVPVQGGTYLGGVARSASGRNGGRSFGGAANHVGAGVRVTVIDHDEIDRRLRGLPPKNVSTKNGRSFQVASSRKPGTSAASDRASSDRVTKAAAKLDEEGKALVRYARKLYLAGKKDSAYRGYQLAIAKLSPKLARLAREEMQRVFPELLVTK